MIVKKFYPIRHLIGAVMLALPLSWPVAAVYDQRLESLGNLIESSSGARQIEQSDNAQASALRQEARDAYELARQAHAAGEDAQVSELLDQAASKMFLAVRMVRPSQSTGEKQAADYQGRKQSVDALLAAQQRVSTEKGMVAERESIGVQVDGLVAKADTLAQRQEYEGAMVLVNQAYMAIKVSVESMRGGDTLVRSLEFETEEDEYHYELDRNDTHRMLADIARQDAEGAALLPDKTSTLLEEALSLREQAERQAKSGQFKSAIDSLEQSTKALVRIIRSSGLYIPG